MTLRLVAIALVLPLSAACAGSQQATPVHGVTPGHKCNSAPTQQFIGKLTRAKAFAHPNLVRVFGVYPTADEVVIAAQWAPGQTLFARVAEQRFSPEEARPLVAQVAAGMTHRG